MSSKPVPQPSPAANTQKPPGFDSNAAKPAQGENAKAPVSQPATIPQNSGAATTPAGPAASQNGDNKQPSGKPVSPSSTSPSALKPFIIKANLCKPGVNGAATIEVTASIFSQTLEKAGLVTTASDVGGLLLSDLRKLISSMSRYSTIHQFCTREGDPITDETITLTQYLASAPTEGAAAIDGLVSSSASAKTTASTPATINTNPTNPTNAAAVAPPASTPIVPETPVAPTTGGVEAKNNAAAPASTTPGESPQLATIFIYYKSPLANRLEQAKQNGITQAPALTGVVPKAVTAPTLLAPADADERATMNAQMAAMRSEFAGSGGTVSKVSAGTLTEDEWSKVLRNCAVFYGWIVDPETKAIRRAPKPAFQLRINLPQSSPTKLADGNLVPSDQVDRTTQSDVTREGEAAIDRAGLTKRGKLIPNFRVNDDSKIDMTICRHELAMSMAKNDFSSESTEASVSGGAFGVTVGVSAGYAKSQSSSSKNQASTMTQTLVARYMYPRCDLFLNPDDLEPTAELADLIEKIRLTKNIRFLRKLQADFGQLFCRQLTVGARLLSTKIMTATTTAEEQTQTESFKVSVGVSVSTPYGGASVKHEQEKGGGTANSKTESNTNESNVFEAVGGDTVLANNPNLWTTSVTSPENWRIINREGLSSLVEMVSEMPGYAAVQSWFVQAVPALGKYLTLGDTRTVTCRLRVAAPTNSLHATGNSALHYLGFHAGDGSGGVISPCSVSTNTVIINNVFANFWIRGEASSELRLFSPQSYRAPVIRGFNDYQIGGAQFGSEYNDEFAAVTWDIIAPFCETLCHGARIILRTKPRDDKVEVAHMVVMRTAQGVFVPAMSDRDEYQYWRIIKAEGGKDGDPIEAGDEIRLCWAFKDQTTGFRDYTEDAFGRRQARVPADIGAVLYLKVPWPRFEAQGKPTAMVMSPDDGTKEALADVTTSRGTYKYMMQDLRFRIDAVDNNGKGDSNDFLLRGVQQQGDKHQMSVTLGYGNPLQMHAAIWNFGVTY